MALHASFAPALNGDQRISEDDEELYTQILQLRDSVIAGQHAHIKLPASVIAQLKASSNVASPTTQHALNSAAANYSAFATNNETSQPPPNISGLPGLDGAQSSSHHRQSFGTIQASAGLDPIFLEKSDSLVRAEGQLKRQRIERDLQAQVDQRKNMWRDKDLAIEGPSRIDVDRVFLSALERVEHVSGLKPAQVFGSPAGSSFDENDYYSSQVESEWSSDPSPSNQSDKGTGALLAGNVRHTGPHASEFTEPSNSLETRAISGSQWPAYASEHQYLSNTGRDEAYEAEGEDDEYTPPGAAAFDSYRENGSGAVHVQYAAAHDDDDDDDEYEPGDVTQDSNGHTPYAMPNQPYNHSPQVPVIRNHLTHIAAPQPNRVSPLATAKGPSIELELVNGRPEIVHKPLPRSVPMQSRISSASPSGNGGSGKKKGNKKRKRDNDTGKRAKKRRDKQPNAFARAQSPLSPGRPEPYIKPEPVSPPPFGNYEEVPQYQQRAAHYIPAEIDLVSPRQPQYANETPRSNLRYEYVPLRVASPGGYRPAQRDTQDLRRVASHQYALRPMSPESRGPTPGTRYRPLVYGQEQAIPLSAGREVYQEIPSDGQMQYVRAERAPSPPRMREYQDPYTGGAQSPAMMPPPATRRIVVDQYGNRYYAAEPAPVAQRASVVPAERRPLPDIPYDRAASRMSVAYAQPPQYDPSESRMAAPSSMRQPANDQGIEYVDANGHRLREYSTRPKEAVRYVEEATSPMYESVQRYEMPPPPAPLGREHTSPIYTPTRAYSVRPDEQANSGYLRQGSIAPVQYARQDHLPQTARAVSVMPGSESQRGYGYAPQPQAVKYVDQYGQEVFPREVRQASEFRYQ